MNVRQLFNKNTESVEENADLNFKFTQLYGFESRIDFLRATYSLHNEVQHYNWDNQYDRLYKIVQHPCCDLSTVKMLYWLNGPIFHFKNSNTKVGIHQESYKFKQYLEEIIHKKEFVKLVEFNLYDFLIQKMDMKNELETNFDMLQSIPDIFFNSSQNGVKYYATSEDYTNAEINLNSKERIYLFGLKSTQILKKLTNCQTVNSLYIFMSGQDVKQNEISNLSKFENLESLTLQCWGDFSKIDFQVFEQLEKLKNVRLITRDNNLSILSNLSKIQALTLSCSRITSIAEIEKLQELRVLKLDNVSKLKNITPLSKIEGLESVFFKGTSLSSRAFNSLLNLNLSSICLDTKSLKNLSFLKKDSTLSKSLKKVFLIKNEVNSDDFFEELTHLSLNPEIINIDTNKDFFYNEPTSIININEN